MLIRVIDDRYAEWWIDAKAVEQLKYLKNDRKLLVRVFGRDLQYEICNVSQEEAEKIAAQVNNEKERTEERRRF